jgi:hypothetical protein
MGVGSGADFYVQPMALSVYADVVRECSGRVSRTVGALESCSVDAAWFGRLPQAGHLAAAYGRHRQSCLAHLGDASPSLSATADGLDANAAAYAGADETTAEGFAAITEDGGGP